MRIPVLILPALVALPALAACGGSDSGSAGDDASDDNAPSGAADDSSGGVDTATATVFSGELEDGSTLTVRLDVDETDALVAPFVAFRAEAGASDDVVWITGSLDAPADYDDAFGPPTGRFLTFVAPGAELIADDATNPTSNFACGELTDWFGTPTGDAANALNERYLTILEDSCDGQTLGVVGEAGATTDYVMVVSGAELPEFDRVYAGLLTELEPVG